MPNAETISRRLLVAREDSTSVNRSAIAKRMFEDLMALPPSIRREMVYGLTAADLSNLLHMTAVETGTIYGMYEDDPVGFVEDVLGETLWSKQREIMESVVHHKRTAVPSAVGLGKTHIASRLTLWRALAYPIGTSLVVTMAPRKRQVQELLWPHIRSAAAKAHLPVKVDSVQMSAVSSSGVMTKIAYGFSAPAHDESAVQGIHHPKLFIVVDEAGGLARPIGASIRGILTGSETRMLAIGNPPTDDEGSWFEGLCEEDSVNVVTLSAYSLPTITGERLPRCRTCPPEMPTHPLTDHMNDQSWIDETIAEYGADAPYVQAKVKAIFPKGGSNRIIPNGWLEAALEPDDDEEMEGFGDMVRLDRLELADEDLPRYVQRGSWVRLGVDVAADGGDEFTIARSVGDFGHIQHFSASAANANATTVAGVVLRYIKRAERLAEAIGSPSPVRVKVDGNGIGWGVVGILQAWRSEGLHGAEIVNVMVSESTGRDDPKADMRPWRKRDEMWIAVRNLLRPGAVGERGRIRVMLDKRTAAQLVSPTYGTNASGYTVVESKKSMKARGLSSPDRGESLLMCFYEPTGGKAGSGVRILVGG